MMHINDNCRRWLSYGARQTPFSKVPVMPKHLKILYVIAEGEHVRFVRPAQDYSLHTEQTVDGNSAHLKSGELVSDRPGAGFHTGSTAHHALNPRHDPHDMEKQKFARSVGARLNSADFAATFDELVLVAPPHVMHEIREELQPAISARIIGTLMKDLVKVPDDELGPHLRDWARPTHRS